MDSEEINRKISECEDSHSQVFECFGGKCIPYIGWFWRTVEFDCTTYSFGVIPAGSGGGKDSFDAKTKCHQVGFMENNKWDYPYVDADEKKWEKIKKLLIKALNEQTRKNFSKLNEEIQSLADGKSWKVITKTLKGAGNFEYQTYKEVK